MTLKCYSPGNKPLGFLNNVFDLKITKEIGGMEELTFFIPANSPEAKMIQLEGYIVPEGEQTFVIRELNTHGKDIEVYCMLAIETLYGFCWSEIAKQNVNLVEAFEYVLKHTGWKFVNRTTTPARTRDIYIQNQTVWEALKVICEVYFVEMTVDTHTHTITAYDSVGQDNGVFFISDMNLVNFRKDTNTHKLITRLIPIGKDGLNITSVNGGKDYIDNNTYSDKLLYGLWMQSAYTNPTQLKEDATKWLAEYAKPYITYNIDIIDLYRLNGNQLFKFNVGDGVTIFDKVTEEKVSQRVVKIEIYPQDPTRNTLELSNKGKTFSDYFQMIQLMQNMANHFVQTNGSVTGTGSTNGSANATVQEGSIGSGHIKADSISTGHLQAGSVTTDKLTANSITTDKIVANSVTSDKLVANSITADKIASNSISTVHLQSNIIDSDKIFAGAVTTDKLHAGSVTADKIATNSISTDKLQANSITSDKIKANNITTNHLQASAITSDKIGANAIEAKHIKAGVVDSQHINSESIKAEHLQANIITSNHIQTGAITAGSGIIANGAIGDAQISSVNANKINAGEIDTSKVKVKGSNGYLFIEDNTLYVVDNNKQIRCELGVISNKTNYGFIVRGSDGKTILIDHNGVHNAGITDGAIDNRKVSENANISGKKLDIDSVIRTINEDGAVSIQGTKVQVGNTTLDVELSKQTNLINNHTTQLNNQQASINANTNAIKLKVDSQTYTADKNNMTTQMNKNTSAISVLEKEIDLKVEQSDITTAVNNVNKTIDTKISSAKAEIKATTDSITQRVQSTESTTSRLQTDLTSTTNKLNDLTVGGTNLIDNSSFHKNYTGWLVNNAGTTTFVTNESKSCCKVAHTALKGATTFRHQVLSRIVPGETYTMSGWVKTENIVKGTTNFSLMFYSDGYYINNGTSTWFGGSPSTKQLTVNTGKGTWEYVTYTFTFPKTQGQTAEHFSVYVYLRDFTGQVYFRDLKLEKGNKSTDWCPSPQDVQSQLDTNASEISTTKSKVATVETNLSGITSRVSNVETKTTNIDGRVTSQEARIKTAESKITDSAIINTVSSTIDNKINAVTIGGRNLYKKTKTVVLNDGNWRNGTNNTTSGTINGFTIIKQGVWSGVGQDIALESNVDYCLSMWVKGDGKSNIIFYGEGTLKKASHSNYTVMPTSWTKYYAVFSSTVGASAKQRVENSISGASLYIYGMKLEKGNKPTDWSPAPEDIESKVDSQYSELKQTASSITATVSDLNGKYTQIKQTVDKIDLTGKVSFSDLSTAGKTTINGANITTGTLSADRVLGGTLKGVSLQTYSGTNTSGVRIHPGGMQLNDTSFFYNNDGKFELQCKQGVNFSSQKDIYLMPGLLASGTSSGTGTVVVPNATLRTQQLYVVNKATFESGLNTTIMSASSTIKGRNNITLDRGSIYIPRLNSSITADYLRLGGGYVIGADTGALHFTYASGRSGALGRSTVYLPAGGGNNTTDHLAFHSGIIACVDSGNFHFVTAGGGNSTIYPRGVVATYSLDNVARTRTTSRALDIISSVPVTQTVEGFRLDVPKARTTENEQLITTSENEQTGELDISTDYNSMLGTMWKAIQELQQEVNELKKENEELKTLLNKEE